MELSLSEDLTVKIDEENIDVTKRKYVFTLEQKSTGKLGTQTIVIDKAEHVDFKNCDILNSTAIDSLSNFWKSYNEISNLNDLGEKAYLLPFVLAKFGIK